jgi:hypothetical protein
MKAGAYLAFTNNTQEGPRYNLLHTVCELERNSFYSFQKMSQQSAMDETTVGADEGLVGHATLVYLQF